MARIGEKIKEQRRWKGLTQQQLANESKISVMSVRRYESGEREPTQDVVKIIAQVLDIHPAELDDRFAINLGSDVTIFAEDGTPITVSAATREGRLLSNFQALNALGKDEVIRHADILLESNKFRKKPLQD